MAKSKKLITPLYVGDRVRWTSQAGGHSKVKIGYVIEVVPPNRVPIEMRSTAMRKHESYVIEVTVKAKPGRLPVGITKKPERYWPVVANLHVVKRGVAPVVMQDYDKPVTEETFEDLKTDHLPVQVLEGDKDLLWKDVQDAERAIANAESTN